MAVLEAPPADRRADRALRAGLGPVRPDAPITHEIMKVYTEDELAVEGKAFVSFDYE